MLSILAMLATGSLLFSFAPHVHITALSLPEPTVANNDDLFRGFTPKPTAGPLYHELLRRQQSTTSDSDYMTCGWERGMDVSPIACGRFYTCAFYTSSTVAMAGCCLSGNYQSCGWATGCMEQVDYSTMCTDSACRSNTWIRKCTSSAAPYCVSWTYPGINIKDYGCTDVDGLGWVTIQTTANGDLITSTTHKVPFAPQAAVTGIPSGSGTALTASDTSRTGLYSSSITFSTPASSYTPSATPVVSIELIAGAIVGGLFIIGMVGGLIFFCCCIMKRRKRAKQTTIVPPPSYTAADMTAPQVAMQQQQPPHPHPQYPQQGGVAPGYFEAPASNHTANEMEAKPADGVQVHTHAISPDSIHSSPQSNPSPHDRLRQNGWHAHQQQHNAAEMPAPGYPPQRPGQAYEMHG